MRHNNIWKTIKTGMFIALSTALLTACGTAAPAQPTDDPATAGTESTDASSA